MDIKNNEAKQFFRKYRLRAQLLIIFIGLIIASLFIADIFVDFMDVSGIIICIVIYMATVRSILTWYRMKRYAIITEELNPPKLKSVLDTIGMHKQNISTYALYHYYNGDYQELIDICTYKLKNDLNDKNYVLFYDYIAGAYFELGDIENLKKICGEYDRDINTSNASLCPMMGYYRLYADGEYEKLKDTYNDSLKSDYNNTTRLRFEYIHAVNLYTLGEVNEAKVIFEDIKNKAPLLSLAKLANKQIEAIDLGKKCNDNPTYLLPNSDFEIPKPQSKAIILKLSRILCYTCILIVIALMLYDEWKGNKVKDEFEKEVYSVIDIEYDNFRLLDNFYLTNEDTAVACISVLQTENGIEMGYMLVWIESNEMFYKKVQDNLKVGEIYKASTTSSNYDITFAIYERKKDIPNNNCYYSQIQTDNGTRYFAILDMKKQNNPNSL